MTKKSLNPLKYLTASFTKRLLNTNKPFASTYTNDVTVDTYFRQISPALPLAALVIVKPPFIQVLYCSRILHISHEMFI